MENKSITRKGTKGKESNRSNTVVKQEMSGIKDFRCKTPTPEKTEEEEEKGSRERASYSSNSAKQRTASRSAATFYG